MGMNIVATLVLGILGLLLLFIGIKGAFKKIYGAGTSIAFGTIFIVTALIISGLVPQFF